MSSSAGSVSHELEGDLEHAHAVQRHPAGRVRLLERHAVGQHRPAVEGPDVVHAEEAATERAVAVGVVARDPPRRVDDEALEHLPQPAEVRAAVAPEDVQGRPGVHRRVHRTEVPLVRRHLSGRVHPSGAQHHRQLLLRERRIDVSERDAVEGEVPGREPRVLPRVGHRDDGLGVEVLPAVVPALQPLRRRGRAAGIAGEPGAHVVRVYCLLQSIPAIAERMTWASSAVPPSHRAV